MFYKTTTEFLDTEVNACKRHTTICSRTEFKGILPNGRYLSRERPVTLRTLHYLSLVK